MSFVSDLNVSSTKVSDPASSAQGKGFQLKEAVDALRKQGDPGWQEFAAKMIRQQRYDQPELELRRLSEAGVLTPETIKRMEQLSDNQGVRVLLAQALELQDIYKDTHYMFLHAYSGPFYPVAVAAKEQKKLISKEQYPQYKFLRSPNLKTPEVSFENFKNRKDISDHRPPERDLLLSVSASPFDRSVGESALWFLDGNHNIHSDVVGILNKFHGFPKKEAEILIDKIKRTNSRNLVVFFIPKEKLSQMAYKAHPMGEVCNCFNADKQKARLERWQAGILDPKDFCRRDESSQFRLWLPNVNPEECRVHMLSTQLKDARREIKEKTKQILLQSNL